MNNISKSSMDYLQRRKILVAPGGRGLFVTNGLHSHFRPVVPLPQLLQPDTPDNRVIMQDEASRVPYIGINHVLPTGVVVPNCCTCK